MRGRMIRVGGRREGAALYAVAEPDAHLALEIIRSRVAKEGEYVEDMGRVTEELISALRLDPGEFKKV